MKKLFVVALALVLALTTAAPAFAAGSPRGTFTHFLMQFIIPPFSS